MARIWFDREGERQRIESLATVLDSAAATDHRMDHELMTPTDRATCRWLGYAIGKGVTHQVCQCGLCYGPHDKFCIGCGKVRPAAQP